MHRRIFSNLLMRRSVSIRTIIENTLDISNATKSLPIHVIKVFKLNTSEINHLKSNSSLAKSSGQYPKQI